MSKIALYKETEEAIKSSRPDLMVNGIAWAVQALAHEALKLPPPATPNERRALAGAKATGEKKARKNKSA
jgi:hypothetical protein